jgi:phage terminase large subunit-like protein
MKQVNDYIQAIQSGEAIAGKYVKLAVFRHLDDLVKSDNPKLPNYFDEDAANLFLKFVSICRHTSGEYANKFFQLLDWQAFIYAMAYGWKRKEDGKRRFQKLYIEIARKNGKTQMMLPVTLYAMLLDGEQTAEVYAAATKKDQANILFHAAQIMARRLKVDSNAINRKLQVQKFSIFVKETNSKFEALGADADTLDGLNVHCAVIDEYHAHKDDKVLKILETAIGARQQPQIWIITTAGFNRHGACYQFREVVANILKGTIVDETIFGIIYTLDQEDDWKDPANWIKANPSLGQTPTQQYMESAFKRAVNEGASAEVHFKTKNLNVWVDAAKTWIPSEMWDACIGDYDADDLAGRQCYGGLDLASVRDLCAFTLVFPGIEEGEESKILTWHFAPEDTINVKREAVGAYKQWVRDGELIRTPGNVTDYAYIKKVILDAAEKYDIQVIAYDRFNSSQLIVELQDEGVNLEAYGQGYVSMSAPSKQLEKMVFERKLMHQGKKIMAWQLGNVEMKPDPAGNIKPTKASEDNKIDGIVSLIMAIGIQMAKPTTAQKSIYEETGW